MSDIPHPVVRSIHDDDDGDDNDDVPILQNLDDVSTSSSWRQLADSNVDNRRRGLLSSSSSSSSPSPNVVPVPVTILTGFLGSGKSTLVKHILTSPDHGRRIAVIENEFGGGQDAAASIDIESIIVRDGTSSSSGDASSSLIADLVELPNGCVCCTVKDALVETLERLLDIRRDLDYVLIEASGMADPGPIASVFWLDGALGSRLRLDGVVCCVDARNIGYQLECTSSLAVRYGAHDGRGGGDGDGGGGGGGDEVARQIAFADRIIVNKVDLLQKPRNKHHRPPSHDHTEECDDDNNQRHSLAAFTAVELVVQQIKSINPTAPILTTTFSKVDDLNWILNANCFDMARATDVESSLQQLYNNPGFGWTNKGTLHRHTDAVGTITLFGIGSVNLHRINLWLASILWPDQDEHDGVLRARLEGRDDDTLLTSFLLREDAPQLKKDRQRIYRAKGVLSVRHTTVDHRTMSNITELDGSHDDHYDEGLAAGLVDEGIDRRRFIVQAVNDLWDIQPASVDICWDDDATEPRCCKIIVIGKWLDEYRLREGFMECFAPSTAG